MFWIWIRNNQHSRTNVILVISLDYLPLPLHDSSLMCRVRWVPDLLVMCSTKRVIRWHTLVIRFPAHTNNPRTSSSTVGISRFSLYMYIPWAKKTSQTEEGGNHFELNVLHLLVRLFFVEFVCGCMWITFDNSRLKPLPDLTFERHVLWARVIVLIDWRTYDWVVT